MNKEACEKVYGNLVNEDDNFYYFEGKGDFGVAIPKNAYFVFQPERLNETDQFVGGDKMVCDSLSSENK